MAASRAQPRRVVTPVKLPVSHSKLVSAFRASLEEGGYVDATKYELAALVALDNGKAQDARVLSELAVSRRLADICTELESHDS
jgi:hypothetical protein